VAAGLLPARLDGFAQGHRWGLWAMPAPGSPIVGAVLVVQACLDEQALSRRMLAHAARGMAQAGWGMLAIDPWGTGDSAGDHGEASLARWRDDLREAARRLRAQVPRGPLVLLGVRLGALIAVDLATHLPQAPDGVVLWNPPPRGAVLLDPLQRVARLGRLPDEPAGSAGQPPGAPDETPAAPARLAGWPIPTGLLDALRGLRLDAAPAPAAIGATIQVIQTQRLTGEAAGPPPALAGALAAWERAGWEVLFAAIAGEPWWSAMDPCDPQPLTDATLAALARVAARAPQPDGAVAQAAGSPSPPAHDARTPALPATGPEALTIPAGQGPLVGVLTIPSGDAQAAVLIVPGQPQTRVGSHRMFVTLATGLQARGIASLRVDLAGWGDSAGRPGPFETGASDIVAAAQALQARLPAVPLWLYGLCDGASALVLALPALHRARLAVRGVCLLNPWVRSEASLAGAMIDGYYRRRLLDPALWRRLVRGQVPLRHLVAEPLRHLSVRLAARRRSPTAGRGDDGRRSLPQALIDALEPYGGEVLTLLAGADLTAAETDALMTADPRWRTRLDRPGRLLRLPGADHTLSDAAAEAAAIEWLAARIAEQARGSA